MLNLLDYKKIMIIGNNGSGKSYFAKELSKITNMPLFHLDLEFWKPNWEHISENEWIEKQPYHVDVASGLMDEQGYLADNMTTDGLHPDFEGKKHIGELVGDYLRANFPDIVNN